MAFTIIAEVSAVPKRRTFPRTIGLTMLGA